MNDIKGSLLLTRKEGENIVLEAYGEKIIINLEKVSTGKAKIRVFAPSDVKIYREEIFKKENFLFNVKK